MPSPRAEASYIKPHENVLFENVPPIPNDVAEATARYGEFRSAQFLSWSPDEREMLITTRFADANEIHLVRKPGGAREQLTFFSGPGSGSHVRSDNRPVIHLR